MGGARSIEHRFKLLHYAFRVISIVISPGTLVQYILMGNNNADVYLGNPGRSETFCEFNRMLINMLRKDIWTVTGEIAE